MTVEEIMKIINQEEQGKLSLNSIALGKSQKQLENEYFVMNGIYSIINGQENIKSMWLKPNLIGKIILRTHGVKKYAYDKKDEAYFVKSKFGNGFFNDARNMFENKTYPTEIEYNKCFSNCIIFARSIEDEVNIVCGKAVVDGGCFTHAVIQFKNCVIDFNYDLIMSADLYYKLTNFEKLNVVSSKRLKQDWARLCNYCGVLEYPYTRDWAILFAYDDYMTRIKERELQK